MGRRGPSKTPPAIKMVRGTYRQDRDGQGIDAPDGLPEKPEWLGEWASEVWDERIAVLSEVPGLLSPMDGPLLAAYCQAWQLFHEAREQIEESGVVAVSEKGGEYQHPAVGTMNKALDTISRLGSKFGMNPSDRAGLHLPEKKQKKVASRRRA